MAEQREEEPGSPQYEIEPLHTIHHRPRQRIQKERHASRDSISQVCFALCHQPVLKHYSWTWLEGLPGRLQIPLQSPKSIGKLPLDIILLAIRVQMQVDATASISRCVQSVLGHLPSLQQPLMEAGLDSLGAVELRNSLALTFSNSNLPATLIFDYPSIAALATFFGSQSAASGPRPASSQGSWSELVMSMQISAF